MRERERERKDTWGQRDKEVKKMIILKMKAITLVVNFTGVDVEADRKAVLIDEKRILIYDLCMVNMHGLNKRNTRVEK